MARQRDRARNAQSISNVYKYYVAYKLTLQEALMKR